MSDRRGQSVGEYGLLIAVVLAVFVGMQTYIKRGVQGSIKDFTDEFGNQDNTQISDPRGIPEVTGEYAASRPTEKREQLGEGSIRRSFPGGASGIAAVIPPGAVTANVDAIFAAQGTSIAGEMAGETLENNETVTLSAGTYQQGFVQTKAFE